MGVALVNIPGSEHLNLEPQLTMVEIKTIVSETTILKAENAREAVQAESVEGDGKVVVCNYDDEIFKKYLPSTNRKQVIHQAVVGGMTWGVFITAKVEELQGSIIQIVFVQFTENDREQYAKILLRVVKPLTF